MRVSRLFLGYRGGLKASVPAVSQKPKRLRPPEGQFRIVPMPPFTGCSLLIEQRQGRPYSYQRPSTVNGSICGPSSCPARNRVRIVAGRLLGQQGQSRREARLLLFRPEVSGRSRLVAPLLAADRCSLMRRGYASARGRPSRSAGSLQQSRRCSSSRACGSRQERWGCRADRGQPFRRCLGCAGRVVGSASRSVAETTRYAAAYGIICSEMSGDAVHTLRRRAVANRSPVQAWNESSSRTQAP